jgi:plastocyanin
LTRFALTLAAFALLATGCGDDDEPVRTVTAQANATLRVVATDYEFDPAAIVLSGAGRPKLTLRNEGSVAHNLKLFRGGQEVGGTPTFAGGRTETVLLILEHGEYRMVCTVGDHEELGMTGTLRVR